LKGYSEDLGQCDEQAEVAVVHLSQVQSSKPHTAVLMVPVWWMETLGLGPTDDRNAL